MKKITFDYMYRTTSNYKYPGEVVVIGDLPNGVSEEGFRERIEDTLFDEKSFVASQVGFPTQFEWKGDPLDPESDDRLDHELWEVKIEDIDEKGVGLAHEESYVDPRSPEEILEAFERAAREGWDMLIEL
jgi:hypothetical protein